MQSTEGVPTPEPQESTGMGRWRWVIGAGVVLVCVCVIAAFVFLHREEKGLIPEPRVEQPADSQAAQAPSETGDRTYGGGFYSKDEKVFINDLGNSSLRNIEVPGVDPGTFAYLAGLAGYDKDNFYYLYYEYPSGYTPVSVPITPEIKRLFGMVETPGKDVKIAWTSNTDVVFGNITYRRMSEYGDFNAFRFDLLELLNNGKTIGYMWVNGLNKTNVAHNKLYLFTDADVTDYEEAVYEVAYGEQPEMVLDIPPHKTTFKPGGSKIYYTKSYDALEFYEYDTVTRTERQIPVQYRGTTTRSSRITLSPDERFLLVKSYEGDTKDSTLLVDIRTGAVEVVREKKRVGKGGDFPFAVSPSNDKVFFLLVPYEGYLSTPPFYVAKDPATGAWGSEVNLPSINVEVGGGWNIDTGQWSISPSGRYLAVADATADSVFSCGGMGDTPQTHNIIKILDLETLETKTLTMKGLDEHFVLNAWASDERGIFATIYKVTMDPGGGCGEPAREGVQAFYAR